MSILYKSANSVYSRSFVIQPTCTEVSNKTFDADARLVNVNKSFILTIPQAKELTLEERCKDLKEILKRRLTKYNIPDCLGRMERAWLYQPIIAHTFFEVLKESEQWKIIDGIRAFNELKGVSVEMPHLSEVTLIPWCSMALNINRVQASLVLGDLMDLKAERCFGRFPHSVDRASMQAPERLSHLPKNLVTDGYMSVLGQTYPIKGISGQILQTACRYYSGDVNITVYADSSMRFGAVELPAILPATDLIEANPKATVHICLCSDVTWKYIAMAREGKLAEREGVVVTGNFGTLEELEALDLRPLLFHPVVIICPMERPEFNAVEKFANSCMSCGAARVSLFSESINV